MLATPDDPFETDGAAHLEPIHCYHDFYVRLFARAAIATFVAALLSLLFLPWPFAAALIVGAALKTLLWLKHLRSRREIEALSRRGACGQAPL